MLWKKMGNAQNGYSSADNTGKITKNCILDTMKKYNQTYSNSNNFACFNWTWTGQDVWTIFRDNIVPIKVFQSQVESVDAWQIFTTCICATFIRVVDPSMCRCCYVTSWLERSRYFSNISQNMQIETIVFCFCCKQKVLTLIFLFVRNN